MLCFDQIWIPTVVLSMHWLNGLHLSCRLPIDDTIDCILLFVPKFGHHSHYWVDAISTGPYLISSATCFDCVYPCEDVHI